MDIKAGFKSIERRDLAALCALAIATLLAWPVERSVSTSIGGFVAIP